jgi:hypothetical protein
MKLPRLPSALHVEDVVHVEHHDGTITPQWAALSSLSLQFFVCLG